MALLSEGHIRFAQVLTPHSGADLVLEALRPGCVDELSVDPVHFYCHSDSLAKGSEHVAALLRFHPPAGDGAPRSIYCGFDDDIVYEVLRILHTGAVFWSPAVARRVAQLLQCADFLQLHPELVREALRPVLIELDDDGIRALLMDPAIFGFRAGPAFVGAALRELLLRVLVEARPESVSCSALGRDLFEHLSQVGSPGRGAACPLPEHFDVLDFREPPARLLKRPGEAARTALLPELATDHVPFDLAGRRLGPDDEVPARVLVLPSGVVESFRRLMEPPPGRPGLDDDWTSTWLEEALDPDTPMVEDPPFDTAMLPFRVELDRAGSLRVWRDGEEWASGLLFPRGELYWSPSHVENAASGGIMPPAEVTRLLSGFLDTLIRCQELLFEMSLLVLRLKDDNGRPILLPVARRSLHLTVFAAYATWRAREPRENALPPAATAP